MRSCDVANPAARNGAGSRCARPVPTPPPAPALWDVGGSYRDAAANRRASNLWIRSAAAGRLRAARRPRGLASAAFSQFRGKPENETNDYNGLGIAPRPASALHNKHRIQPRRRRQPRPITHLNQTRRSRPPSGQLPPLTTTLCEARDKGIWMSRRLTRPLGSASRTATSKIYVKCADDEPMKACETS